VRDLDLNSKVSKWLVVSVILLTLAVLVLDFLTGRGYAVAVLYVVPILLSLWTKDLRTTSVLALICPLLVILGYFVSAERGSIWLPVSNRIYSFVIVGAAGILALQRKRASLELLRMNDE